MQPRQKALQDLAVDALLTHGPLTADEAAEIAGVTVLAMRPRFSELHKAGKIADAGERRPSASGKTATVWKLTPTGPMEQTSLFPEAVT
jgi:predicted ArsR family transcriptional regulator|tara:strand:- start:4 stop:270 length:267 start_codon:yes stop_codon:yes gene_type:complete